MMGLVFGLERNVCGYILVYTDSQSFFWWVCPWTTGGWGGGGGGMGLGEGTMVPRVPSLKKTTNWATDFLVHSKKGKGLKVVG